MQLEVQAEDEEKDGGGWEAGRGEGLERDINLKVWEYRLRT
jgi:hypothetical protein